MLASSPSLTQTGVAFHHDLPYKRSASHTAVMTMPAPAHHADPAPAPPSNIAAGDSAQASGSSATRPKNHVRSSVSESRVYTTGRTFVEGRYREKQLFVSPQEQKEFDAERDAVLQLQAAQAAKRRPKVMRLTPAFSSKDSVHPMSPSLDTPTGAVTSSPTSEAPTSKQAPPHPASRKAMALKPNNPGPPVLGGLSLDLHCLPSPAGDRSSMSSAAFPHHSELVRKKSGEPVKSSLKYSGSFLYPRSATEAILPSAYSAKSVPATPSTPKAVHFDSQLERVKVFKVKGRPQAVSREGSPEQTETETEEEKDYPWFGSRRGGPSSRSSGTKSPQQIATPPSQEPEEQLMLRLPNFPSSAKLSLDKDIFLERVYLSDDLRSIRGTVQVKNISFEKWVAVRFTLDHWATVNEVSAEHSESIKDGTADRFVFSIKLNEVLNWPRGAGLNETKTIFLCLRYTTGGREIWDNNNDLNYQLDFRKRIAQPAGAARLPPASGEPKVQSPSFGSSVPRRYTLSTMGPASTSSIIEMGRRTGVYGQGTRDHAMERLKQELERLRSDEEEAEKTPVSGHYQHELAKFKSPPESPSGHGRPGSPALWAARYDFGASLRDPKTGSRKTEAGRAAALDYFSVRPASNATSPVRSTFVLSAATPSPDTSTPQVADESASKFGRLGMLSPGLGESVVEHPPTGSGTTSATASATNSPTGSSLRVPQLSAPGSSTPNRFQSFAAPSPNGFTSWDHGLRKDPTSESGSGSATPPSPLAFASGGQHMQKLHGLPSEYFTPDGSLSNSLTNSPNPFSPALSTSSMDSDSTAGIADNKTNLADSLDNLLNRGGPSSYSYLRSDPSRTPPSYAQGDEVDHHGYASSALSSSATLSPSSELATPDDDFLRPSNLSSFNELVARFCWNSDNQVPLTVNDIHDNASPTPNSTSGRSTPTASAGAY